MHFPMNRLPQFMPLLIAAQLRQASQSSNYTSLFIVISLPQVT